MRQQSREKLAQLIESFPAIGLVRYNWRWKSGEKWRQPITNVHVQRADTEAMHLQANNIAYWGRSYMTGKDDSQRGTRTQYLWAIDTADQVLAALQWEPGEFAKMSIDIFNSIPKPERVQYLLWVTAIEWYPAATQEREAELDGMLFGPNKLRTEVFITVYRRPQGMTWSELIKKADREKFEREDAQNHPPKEMLEFPHIHQALRDGCRLHAFLSGGGLRIVRLELDKVLKGYGEHPHVEVALTHLDEDYAAGGRDYNATYGPKGCYTGYLTGSNLPSNNLDAWVRRGQTFDVWQEGDEIVFQLAGYTHYTMPDWVEAETKAKPGVPVQWSTLRGFTYEAVYIERLFANGEPGHSIKTIFARDKGRDSSFYPSTKTGRGSDFWSAMNAAFEAPEEEKLRDR